MLLVACMIMAVINSARDLGEQIWGCALREASSVIALTAPHSQPFANYYYFAKGTAPAWKPWLCCTGMRQMNFYLTSTICQKSCESIHVKIITILNISLQVLIRSRRYEKGSITLRFQ